MGCTISDLAAKFAFFPPTPATYSVQTRAGDGKLVAVPTTSPATGIPQADESSFDTLLIPTKRGNNIAAFYLRNPYARLTLVYSHGNATDLGHLYDLFLQLKINLRVNLMGYDYSGYGASTGKPSESNTYADIEAVYECLQTNYGVGQEDIILYGQSVGSGPTLHLASKLPRLRGVVLHSAILSGLRVICHVKFWFCFDMYNVSRRLQPLITFDLQPQFLYFNPEHQQDSEGEMPCVGDSCKFLAFVLLCFIWFSLEEQGTDDEVVNWLHGEKLWKMAREPHRPLWINGGGHCNLELYPEFVRHLGKFVIEMENLTSAVRLKKIKESLQSQRRCWRIRFTSLECVKPVRLNCSGLSHCHCCTVARCFRRPKCIRCPRFLKFFCFSCSCFHFCRNDEVT